MIEGHDRGCCFDLYDTLVFFKPEEYRIRTEAAAKLCGVSAHEYSRAWKGLTVESNAGKYRLTEHRVRRVLQILGAADSRERVKDLVDLEHTYLEERSYLYEDALPTLESMRRRGIRLGIVTNASSSVWHVIRSKGLLRFFGAGGIVVSSKAGVRKPAPIIYLEALRRLGVQARHSAFVGDGNDRELNGAKTVGLTTILVKRPDFRANLSGQSTPGAIDVTVAALSEIPSALDALRTAAQRRPPS